MKARLQSILAVSVAAAAAALASATVAQADGMERGRGYYEQPYNWSGVYFGAHAGVMWTNIDSAYTATTPLFNVLFPPSQNNVDPVVGGHMGIQHQWGAWVLGVEGGFEAVVAAHTGHASPIQPSAICAGACIYDARVENTLYVGPRVGYAMGRWMPYVTGGYASGRVDTEAGPVATPGSITQKSTERQNGWFAGVGVDWALGQNAVLGLEYRHYDLGDTVHEPFSFPGGVAIPSNNRDVSATEDLITARVSFKFGPSAMAPLK